MNVKRPKNKKMKKKIQTKIKEAYKKPNDCVE